MSGFEDEMLGTATDTIPPLRTFRVEFEDAREPIYVEAHMYGCEREVAKFFTYRSEVVGETTRMVAFSNRSVRHWHDIEDVTYAMVPGSALMN